MRTHNEKQGSHEWLELRNSFFTASEAPAMLGLSKYKTRQQLMREKATGVTEEVDEATQRRFNAGHAAEAAARLQAEKELREELFPVVGSETIDGIPLLASFDGITMDSTVAWENKLWNEEFAESVRNGIVPDTHWPQLEQQLMVSGAELVLFTVSDGTNFVSIEYRSQPERRAMVLAGWVQFAKDMLNFKFTAPAASPKGAAIMDLPALSVQATGMVTQSNLPEFKAAAESYIASINTKLVTDQDFADAETTVKFCKSTEEKLDATMSAILAQTASIDDVIRTVDHIQAQLKEKRLLLDKLVKSEKEARKAALVSSAAGQLADHIAALQAEISGVRLIAHHPDFGGAIKGLKSLASMQDALDTTLANGKIAADATAKDVRAKLAWCNENAAGHSALIPDLQQLIVKPMEDFTLTIATRIKDYNDREHEKLAAERERIQAEATAKANTPQPNAAADAMRDNPPPSPTASVSPALTANLRPSDAVILTAIAGQFNVPYKTACKWVAEIVENMNKLSV